ncbi:hypothetical protein MIR68_007681 [Amoeboaphelidium protococcarum]|nr:hypothetical protein MIR68_007681 [Amoeboaphelidium protococcarum]
MISSRRQLGGCMDFLKDLGYRYVPQRVANRGDPLTLSNIRRQMRLIVGDDQFKASTGWVYGFLERFGLSLRAITCRVNAHKFTSIRDNFDDKVEKMAAFRTYIKDVIYQHQFSDLQIYNVDQTPVWFDHPPSKVIDHRGAKQVYCKSMVSNLREKATVVLAVRQDGYKLPPLVVVKTSQKRFRLKLVNGVMLFLNPRSSMMNSDLMSKYMKLIFGQSREQRLLILDSFRGHLAHTGRPHWRIAASRHSRQSFIQIPFEDNVQFQHEYIQHQFIGDEQREN